MGASRSCAGLSSEAPAKDLTLRLLGGEQPPPARLASLEGLDLDSVGNVRVDLGQRDRRVGTGEDRHHLGALAEDPDRLREGRSGAAPGHDLLADETDGVALAEAALAIVAGRRRDPAGRDP